MLIHRPNGAESAELPELGTSAYSTLVHVQAEIKDIVKIGYLNGLFVLARSIGLIGHALDQKRLQQGLYRHPWDEVIALCHCHLSLQLLGSPC